MLKLHHAERLVEDGYTATTWGSGTTKFITTSTINDERLDSISWSEERDIVREFNPTYHIPTDVSVYASQPTDERAECIENCMTGAAYMQSELEEYAPSIIPLFKGITHSERELCLSAADALGVDTVAIYVSPYFSSKQGNNRKQLFHDLNRCRDHDMPDVFLIGLLSPKYLERVPEFVVAAAGQYQWRQRYEPEIQSTDEMRSAYHQLEGQVGNALGITTRNVSEQASTSSYIQGD
ncbi:hypothetical protein D3D01_15520 [Haloarcula sp. Atlit-7R]|nr:hypothetical protein D3D01_15520 [Haloarcula sp. Atlit-7R]